MILSSVLLPFHLHYPDTDCLCKNQNIQTRSGISPTGFSIAVIKKKKRVIKIFNLGLYFWEILPKEYPRANFMYHLLNTHYVQDIIPNHQTLFLNNYFWTLRHMISFLGTQHKSNCSIKATVKNT